MIDYSPFQRRAYEFARDAHGSQVRRYTNEPYINHPVRVAETVRYSFSDYSQGVQDVAVASALLHDVVEGTSVTHAHILKEFGKKVARIVFFLTDISRPEDGNRELRKTLDRWHICCAPSMAKTIKLADMLDNTESIVKYDPDFARVYMKEKELLLKEMGGGDHRLHNRCRAVVKDYRQLFG